MDPSRDSGRFPKLAKKAFPAAVAVGLLPVRNLSISDEAKSDVKDLSGGGECELGLEE